MKKIIPLFFAMAIGCQGLMAMEPVVTPAPSAKGFSFKIDFHTPRSQCTKFLGICSISFCLTLNFEEGEIHSGEVPCMITLNQRNDLIIQLSEEQISRYDPDFLKFISGKSTLTFDDTYDISAEISKGIQSQRKVVIRPGDYPLSYQSGTYTLIIPLQ